jgi:hypothetical protein
MRTFKILIIATIAVVLAGCKKVNEQNIAKNNNDINNIKKLDNVADYEFIGKMHNQCLDIIANDINFFEKYNNLDYLKALLNRNLDNNIDNNIIPDYTFPEKYNNFEEMKINTAQLLNANKITQNEFDFYSYIYNIVDNGNCVTLEYFPNRLKEYLSTNITSNYTEQEKLYIFGTISVLLNSYDYWTNVIMDKNSPWNNEEHFNIIYLAHQNYIKGNSPKEVNWILIAINASLTDARAFSDCVSTNCTQSVNGSEAISCGRACAKHAAYESMGYVINAM